MTHGALPHWLTGRVHVTRIGLTPVKGTRHAALPSLRLEEAGPVGDRLFCLVDVDNHRVVRTVDHPRLVLVETSWDGTALTVRTPDGREATSAPRPTGEWLTLDYWGRGAQVELLCPPHVQLLADHLGRDLHLARVGRPGEIVYGNAVSIVTTGAMAEIDESTSSRFRATFTIEADEDPAPGTELHVGEAVLRVRTPIPRCRVIDINPATGEMDRRHLATLAERPRRTGELPFGVDADVIRPGTVRTGDAVVVTDPSAGVTAASNPA